MRWSNLFITRLRALLRREDILDDIEEEMRSHIELETETNLERGMKPDEARVAALRSFGNLAKIRDLAYDVRGGGMLETLWQDLRYSLRMLRKHPAVTSIIALSMGLAIGANTTVYTWMESLVL